MKKINLLLRKCKSLSKQLGRSSSYTSLRSKSTTNHDQQMWRSQSSSILRHDDEDRRTVFVGSTRKRYVISSKCLSHPVVNALIDKSSTDDDNNNDDDRTAVVKCEVVLFDHLLWMLDNADPNSIESLQELADLYVF
ncbi:Auxin-responsive protein SAUR76 [Linum perenne]